MQEKEITEILLKNTELNIINSDLQNQLDEQSKVRDLLQNTMNTAWFFHKRMFLMCTEVICNLKPCTERHNSTSS